MILTVDLPDTLVPYLNAAAVAAGHTDLNDAIAAHLATLIRDTAQRKIHDAAMAAVTSQVQASLSAVDAQNSLITVQTEG